jgi:hypothetical protein
MEQLFNSVNSGITTPIKNKIYKDPDLTRSNILKLAENFHQTTTKNVGY